MDRPVYMDHHATTPLDPAALEAMTPFLTSEFGNPSSRTHRWGWTAEEAVEQARGQIAGVLNCRPDEVLFTGGATESNNMAVKGVARAYLERGKNRVVATKVEHHSVLEACQALEKEGFEVVYLDVDPNGMVDPNEAKRAVNGKTALVSVVWAHNEYGTINPIAEIGRIAREAGALFHTDGVQAFGKYDSDVDALNVDLMSISAHKIYGPKGVGALYMRKRRPRIRFVPLVDGGGQERGYRSGTLNVPAIVGFGKAAQRSHELRAEEAPRIEAVRNDLRDRIFNQIEYARLNGHPTERLYGNLNFSFEFVQSEAVLLSMRGVALSSGSACTSKSLDASYALRAMGIEERLARSAIRFGLGRGNTMEDSAAVADMLAEKIEEQRQMSPLYRLNREQES